MKRFENAQVGDLVYCRKNGEGKIDEINYSSSYPISCYFSKFYATYKKSGHIDGCDVEPMLFYRKGEERYQTERPEPEIDWANVKRGTMFYVGDSKEAILNDPRTFHIFDGVRPWFKTPRFGGLYAWEFSKPANPSEVPYK